MAKLRTVELGRGLAAGAVVLFHANISAGREGLASFSWLVPLQQGVDFFFVLSGFIIFYVHHGDIGRSERAGPYLIKRAIRLYPVLWIIAGSWLLLRALFGEPASMATVTTSLLLHPSSAEPMPVVVWTLRHELLFYAAFTVAILNRKVGLSLFILWTLGVLAQMLLIALGRPLEGIPAMLLSSYELHFAFGAVLALVAPRVKLYSWWPLALGLVMVLALSWASLEFGLARHGAHDYTSRGNLFVPVVGFAFAVVLFGLLCIEDRVRMPGWAMLLGGASYAIYLVHSPIIAATHLVAGWLGNGMGHLLIFGAGIAGGIVFHLAVEKRVTAGLRNILLPRRRSPEAVEPVHVLPGAMRDP